MNEVRGGAVTVTNKKSLFIVYRCSKPLNREGK